MKSFCLDPVMVLVPFLFSRSPLGILIDHVAKSARKDHEDEEQEDKWWHDAILYWCIPDQMLASDEYAKAI